MKRRVVLLVDDVELIHQIAEHYLDPYTLVSAFDGATAIELLRTTQIDLVILDIELPDTSGLKLLQQIRLERPRLPILMFSSRFDCQQIDEAMRRGATGFLAKWPNNLEGLAVATRLQTGE